MNKKCLWCNIKFIISEKEKLFCSSDCRKKSAISKKKYREEHKKEMKEYQKKYHKIHYKEYRIEKLIYAKKYQKENEQKIKEYQKIYHIEHRAQLLSKRRKYIHKYLKNPIHRLILNLRCRIRMALKNNSKSGYSLELIGCSTNFLKKHLEKQFIGDMSWQNYGKWHIDHILPCSSFNLSIPEQQKLCFNYKNLRPLWAKENLERPKRG